MPSEASKPMFDADRVAAQLRNYDRAPFMDLLNKWIEHSPNEKDLKLLAEQKPHMYINAMASLARMAGFTEKKEINVTGSIDFHAMGDSQLEDELAKRLSDIGMKVIDGKLVDEEARDQAEDAKQAAQNVLNHVMSKDSYTDIDSPTEDLEKNASISRPDETSEEPETKDEKSR